jgi:pyruvate formate lyase activating enzyme
MVGRMMTVAQVMAEIERDIAFFDESGGGVTFSGGEPLLQPSFLRALAQMCKAKGIHTVVDTCGWATWSVVDSLRPYVDLFLYDLKLMDDERHEEFTGVSNQLILRNLEMLSVSGHAISLRVPIIPGINDDPENVRQIGRFAAALPQAHHVNILPYHHAGVDKYNRLNRAYALPEIQPPTNERMIEIQKLMQEYHLQVKIGG